MGKVRPSTGLERADLLFERINARLSALERNSGLLPDQVLQGQTLVQFGSAAFPGLAFDGDTDTGLWRQAGDVLALVTGGSRQIGLHSSALWMRPQIRAAAGTVGSAAAPSYSFDGDTNTGFYRSAADAVKVATGGIDRATFSASGLTGLQALGVTGQSTVRQPSTAANSWAGLFQMEGVGGGSRFLLLCQSNVNVAADNEFYVLDNGNVFADGSFSGGGADYAEWFEHEEPVEAGTVAGLNLDSGKVRPYRSGDVVVGVGSSNPAFIAATPNEESKDDNSLVGMVGQVQINSDQVKIGNRVVRTADNRVRLGYLLSNGRILLSISNP